MKMQPYIVYVKPDDQNRIIAVNSSAFLADVTNWVEIDRGFDDRYHHAQGNYFPLPVCDERGVCRYALVDGLPVERAKEEMDADAAAFVREESSEVLLLEMAADHEYRICLLELGIDESEVMSDDV